MKIEIWGTYPPPIGGVSIHIMRFMHEVRKYYKDIVLKDFNGLETHEYDYIIKVDNKLKAFFHLLFRKKILIHLHSNKFIVFLFLLIFGRKHKIGLTIHNKNLVKTRKIFKKKIITIFLKKIDFIIINDPEYAQEFIDFFKINKLKVSILPAYIKPLEIERNTLSEEIIRFRKSKEFLISANAFMLRFEKGIDVYGFDLLIDLVEKLKNEKINTGLIFCLPQIGNRKYYDQLKELIQEKEIDESIFILQEKLPNAFEIWEVSDLFIRPTTTDIEGISVKEALDFNTPVIASDVCKRPDDAIIFKNRDSQDLFNKTMSVYNVFKSGNRGEISFKDEQVVPQIIEIYKSIIG